MELGGILEKASIYSFTNDDLTTPATPFEFVLPINPESMRQQVQVRHDSRVEIGQQHTTQNYLGTPPESMNLEFIFDQTGLIENYAAEHRNKPVRQQVAEFLAVVYNMVSSAHEPRYLVLVWGARVFPCKLGNLDIQYTLYGSNGEPLRAKMNATFRHHVPRRERNGRSNKQSPDLTHERIARDGDRLDWLTNGIYNTPELVYQVARANELTTFRQLKPGSPLRFPPLEKTA